ncbi:MAG: diacylglycerol kinase family protein [Hydrogenibacillus sp.]|nr:diacylglycerol kinase family protein [Hydrogenibacillus sp.]
MSEGRRLIRSFRNAFDGLYAAFHDEHNMRIHGWVALMALLLAAWLKLPVSRWLIVGAMIVWVWSVELVNTAVERAVDHGGEHRSAAAKTAKDAASAAVFLSALLSVLVGLYVFYTPLTHALIDLKRTSAGDPLWLAAAVGFAALCTAVGIIRPRLGVGPGMLFGFSAFLFWASWFSPLVVLTFVLPPLLGVFVRRGWGSVAALACWGAAFSAVAWAWPVLARLWAS